MKNNNENPIDTEDEPFYYDLEEATEIVLKNIPQYMRDKYEYKDIYFILELEIDYLDSISAMYDEESPIHNYPIDIKQEEMEKHIVTSAIKNDILLTYEELDEIIGAEMIYYEMNGALGDAGEYLN